MKKFLLSFIALLCAIVSNAQIGYQVSLLNTATGEPRSCETVSCLIELTDSEGTVICSETKTATSNDFGVISLSVGNANTFDNMDWSKLPLYISVTIDGKLVGKSQVLTVPVAECAKKLAPNPDFYGTWAPPGNNSTSSEYYTFEKDGKCIIKIVKYSGHETDYKNGEFFIQGNVLYLWHDYNDTATFFFVNGKLIGNGDWVSRGVYTKQQ